MRFIFCSFYDTNARMISTVLGNQDLAFLFFLITIVVAMVLVWIIARGIQTGMMPTYSGFPIQRRDQPTAFWLHAAVYAAVAVIILAGPTLLQLKNLGLANWAAFFWIFGRVFGIAAILAIVVLRGFRPRTVSTVQRPPVAGNGPVARLAWVYMISVVAITFMVPLEYHGNGHRTWVKDRVLAMALIPAFLAWLMILKRPVRENLAFIRGGALAVGFVGAGALALLPYADQMGGPIREMVESARFPIQAKAYLGVGLLGLIASFLFGRGQPERSAID
jgi:hypothetical protein